MLPMVLKNFNLFVDTLGYAGKVEELSLPKLTIKTEDFRAGGMDASVPIDMGMEKLELTGTLSEFNRDVLALWGVTKKRVPLIIRGAQADERGNVQAIEVKVEGLFKEIDPGSWKAGDKASMKFSVEARVYKVSVGGRPVINIDIENMVRVVNGVDQLAQIRAAIGV